jgi:hypothetical protein
LRLLKIVSRSEAITRDHVKAVLQNVVWVNPKVFPNGSLDYDFEFSHTVESAVVDEWMEYIGNGNGLDEVEVPSERIVE